MASTRIKGGSSMGRMGNMHEGMKNNSPPCYDESMKPPKGSVDSEATREGVAPTPKTLGDRNA